MSALSRELGGSKVDDSPSARETYSNDDSEVAPRVADVVVHATSADDIAATLAIADAHGVPVTPRAGGTGRTGGAVPAAGGILLATDTMKQVLEIDRDDLVAVVEPGIVTADFHAMVEREGLFYPPDPNSLKMCMLGGNLAENAGGPRAFKYGVTREYVLGLEACLMGGQLVRTGRRTVKGVTGYDLTALFVGSEGTLGVFSRATLKLVRKPGAVATVLALFADVRAAAAAVVRVIGAGLVPRCMELLDEPTLGAVRAQGVSVDTRAKSMLLLELDGDPNEVEHGLERLGNVISSGERVVDVVAAQDAAQRDRLWEGRRQLSPATRKLAKHKLSEDVVVPRSRMVALLERVDRISEATRVRSCSYGHAGDGNLHVNFFWNRDEERPAVDRALRLLMEATVELGGTLTGEHGIGVTKIEYLPIEQSPELIQLQRDLKKVFDPKGLLNPGKIFAPTSHEAC
jgi:glycolate oxidase